MLFYFKRFTIAFCLIFLMLNTDLIAQQVIQAPNVYLDCNSCSFDYVRTNVSFVNYVRDQADAGIFLRITRASTGSGREYLLDFRGIPPFSTRRDTLVYITRNTDTSDEERAGLVRYIRLGLVPFVAQTAAGDHLDITFNQQTQTTLSDTPIIDKWDNWIFDIDLGASFDGEESEFSYEIESRMQIERITENWKYEFDAELEIDRTSIDLSSGTRKVNRDSWELDGFVAHSLANHFSIGIFTGVSASKTGNISLNIEASPAIEYSVFPYREFQERKWIFQYRLTPSYRDYNRTTIYLKDTEVVARQVLSTEIRYDQPWGQIYVGIASRSYLHDLNLNSFEINPSFDVRIARGLSFYASGSYSIINDQISLPADDITDTELLLGERQQATSFDYRLSFGLSFTFGSKYSNVVNPRLD